MSVITPNPTNKWTRLEAEVHDCLHDLPANSARRLTAEREALRALDQPAGPQECDPTGRLPHQPGAKLDEGKLQAALLLQFPRALEAVAQVATFGARKYSTGGWLEVPDGINRYAHAEWRHKLARAKKEERDADSGLLHQAHEVWCVLAQLELQLRQEEETA